VTTFKVPEAKSKRWGKQIACKGRLFVYHDTDVGDHQFNVVVWRYGREVGSGSLACVIDNSEALGDYEVAIALTEAEVDWLLDVQEKFDV